MMKQRRAVVPTSVDTLGRFSVTLADSLIDTAVAEQHRSGRGVLWVYSDSNGMTWRYKGFAECSDELSEWSDLEPLLAGYDTDSEVLIAILNGGVEFFRLPMGPKEKFQIKSV